MRQRLHKLMARAGWGSRRHCEQVMAQGRVRVNGQVMDQPGAHADPAVDDIRVDGVALGEVPREKTYLLLHKPPGYLTSRRDPRGRRLVTDLLPPLDYPVHAVGRLDYDASGLLLMTNDGDLTFALTHPSRQVPKTYLVDVMGHPTGAALTALRRGVELEDGRSAPARVKVVEMRPSGCTLSISIHEGRKHQVKRMCRAVGHEVMTLRRVRLAGLSLGPLAPGQWRHLTAEEVRRLREAAGLEARPGRAVPGRPEFNTLPPAHLPLKLRRVASAPPVGRTSARGPDGRRPPPGRGGGGRERGCAPTGPGRPKG